MSSPIAVYIHTPFCPSKCGYCDFNSYAMSGEIVERTVRAMKEEIRRSPWRGRPAKTIFFGGGTPTFLEEDQLCSLLEEVMLAHPPIDGCEVTSEANPGTADAAKFRAMRESGFNRLSLGAQSFDTGDLIRLGRVHEPGHVGRAIGMARNAGFENINIDLMFALPGQSPAAWQRNLELALRLGTDHLSLYCLTIEPNTRYYRLHLKGLLDLPDDERQVEMYDLACELTAQEGFQQYEISNFCRPGKESQHNLCYWRGEEYLGYGPGAVGCVGGSGQRTRRTVLKQPERYCETIEAGQKIWFDEEVLDIEAQRLEAVMLGIRLQEGIEVGLVQDQKELDKLRERGWVDVAESRIRLTQAGRHFASEVAIGLA